MQKQIQPASSSEAQSFINDARTFIDTNGHYQKSDVLPAVAEALAWRDGKSLPKEVIQREITG